MASEIDPRLEEELRAAGAEDEVEAFILVRQSPTKDAAVQDERGPGGELLDRVTRRVGEQPAHTKFLPRLGVVVVRGSPRLIRALLADAAVVSASSAQGEVGAI